MSKFLDEFAARAKENGHNIFRVSEIVGECDPETAVLHESCDCLNCYSVAKVFTAVATGFLEEDGLLDVDERIVDIFPEYITEKTDPRWQKVTVDMVLRHRCGFPQGNMDIDKLDIYENFGTDFLAYIFNTPLALDPGREFSYSDSAYYLLSRVVSAKCSLKLDEYLWQKLFLPLRFQEMAWSKCPMGYPMGATGLYIRSCDLVKLGALLLHGGVYKGQRILSKAWIERAKEREYDLYPTNHGQSFYKGGMNGQELVMIPEADRCVAWHACEWGEKVDRMLEFVCNYR